MIINNARQINRWIKEERKVQGKSQSQVAESAYITPQCLCGIERDRRQCSIDSLIALASALGYRVELIKEEGA